MKLWNFREVFRLYNPNLPLYLKSETGREYPLTWQTFDYEQGRHCLYTTNCTPLTLRNIFDFLDSAYKNRNDVEVWVGNMGCVKDFQVVYRDGKLIFEKR